MNKYVMELSETMSSSLGTVSGASTGRLVAKLNPKQTSSGASSSGPRSRTEIPMLKQSNTLRILSKSRRKCLNCFDMIFLIFEKKTELLPSKNWRRCLSRNLSHPRIGQFEHGLIICRGEEEPTKDPNTVSIRKIRIDLCLQDLVVLPDDFAEHIYHVGNSTNLHSIIRSGLIAGGSGAKKREANSVLHGSKSHGNMGVLANGV